MGSYHYERLTKEIQAINPGYKKSDIGKWIVHYTGDGWVSTLMTNTQKIKFEHGKLNYDDFEWE